jgi:hypothetical protein
MKKIIFVSVILAVVLGLALSVPALGENTGNAANATAGTAEKDDKYMVSLETKGSVKAIGDTLEVKFVVDESHVKEKTNIFAVFAGIEYNPEYLKFEYDKKSFIGEDTFCFVIGSDEDIEAYQAIIDEWQDYLDAREQDISSITDNSVTEEENSSVAAIDPDSDPDPDPALDLDDDLDNEEKADASADSDGDPEIGSSDDNGGESEPELSIAESRMNLDLAKAAFASAKSAYYASKADSDDLEEYDSASEEDDQKAIDGEEDEEDEIVKDEEEDVDDEEDEDEENKEDKEDGSEEDGDKKDGDDDDIVEGFSVASEELDEANNKPNEIFVYSLLTYDFGVGVEIPDGGLDIVTLKFTVQKKFDETKIGFSDSALYVHPSAGTNHTSYTDGTGLSIKLDGTVTVIEPTRPSGGGGGGSRPVAKVDPVEDEPEEELEEELEEDPTFAFEDDDDPSLGRGEEDIPTDSNLGITTIEDDGIPLYNLPQTNTKNTLPLWLTTLLATLTLATIALIGIRKKEDEQLS